MVRVGIIFGLLLCGLSVAALVASTQKYPSQFVPMMVGIPIFFCSVFALNPHRRKHAMHSAAAVGLLGLVFAVGLLIQTRLRLPDGDDVKTYIMRLGGAMAVLCLCFVAACVVSFVQTRSRKASVASRMPKSN